MGFFWWSFTEACVSFFVPLAMLLYRYITYCPVRLCKKWMFFFLILCALHELDCGCDLVNVIVSKIGWFAVHIFKRTQRWCFLSLLQFSDFLFVWKWTIHIFESNLFVIRFDLIKTLAKFCVRVVGCSWRIFNSMNKVCVYRFLHTTQICNNCFFCFNSQ